MTNLLRELNQRPIAYYPIYRQITGSTTGGILLSQLMYWLNTKDKIFKTDKEIMGETLLTEKELRTAKKLIKNLDFITVSIEGIPAKTYYEISWNLYEIFMITFLNKETNKYSPKGETGIDETDDTVSPKGRNCNSQKGETYNVKSLTETTTETTTENKKQTKKTAYEEFILTIKDLSPIKSKVTMTDKGKKIFKTIENKEQFISDYVAHQIDKGEYAKRVTAFMEDYNTMPLIAKSKEQRAMQGVGNWLGQHQQQGGAVC